MQVPIGWTGTLDRYEADNCFAVLWDDDTAAPGGKGNMGWCIWTVEELLRDAEVLP